MALLRLQWWLFQLLLAIDQLAYVWIAGWFYVWFDKGPCPDANETISSRVGRSAIEGRPWALICEALIDRLFLLLTRKPGHCRSAIGT